jgi:hypothetical protein
MLAIESNVEDSVGVSDQGPQVLACRHVPNKNTTITRAGYKDLIVILETEDRAFVSSQGLSASVGLAIPNPVSASQHLTPMVGRENRPT